MARRFGGLLRISLAVGLSAAGALSWAAGPTSAAPAQTYTRTVVPNSESPPLTPPAVDLTAACVRKVRGGMEAVFGYENHAPTSILVSLDPDTDRNDNANVIVRIIKFGPVHAISIEDLGPQVTLFKPGVHPYAFAVRYDSSDKVSWRVRVPESGGGFGSWWETVSPVEKAECERDVPGHFAVIQDVGLEIPVPVHEVLGPEGEIVSYNVVAGMRSMRATCSAGGQLLAPEVVQGWPAIVNLKSFKPDYQVEIHGDTGSYFFDMSTKLERPVANIFQPVEWRGPIADVAVGCQFGHKVVTSEVFWAEAAGFGAVSPVLSDDGTKVIGFGIDQKSPLGSRLR